jgi:hypothetical protein
VRICHAITLFNVSTAGGLLPVALYFIPNGPAVPGRFANPDESDRSRDASGHPAFGHGIRHCLGAHLADWRSRSLLARFPALALAVPASGLRWGRASARGVPVLAPEPLHAAPPRRRGRVAVGFLAVRGSQPARGASLLKDFVVVKDFRRCSVGNPSQQQKFT